MSAPRQLPREMVLDTLSRTLAPYLGRTMALAAVETHRQKLGIDGLHMTSEQLDALMGKMSAGLVIFVGRDKTETIVREARAAISSLESRT
jgi:hypothetical protein